MGTTPTSADEMMVTTPRGQPKFKQGLEGPTMLVREAIDANVVTHTRTAVAPTAPPVTEPPTVYQWKIDAKKIRSNDRSIVSRPFALALGAPGSEAVTCK